MTRPWLARRRTPRTSRWFPTSAAPASRPTSRTPTQVRETPYRPRLQKLDQLQPFVAVFPQEGMGQLATFGPT
jgi:hypothetical protein